MIPRQFPVASAVLCSVFVVFDLPASACASAAFGTLSNFDVFNDTGEDCHGFEIELDGLTGADGELGNYVGAQMAAVNLAATWTTAAPLWRKTPCVFSNTS